MRIGLLLCDSMPDEYLPIAGKYVAMFSGMFHNRAVTMTPFDAHRGELPDSPLECDGYVISGSRASVYEDEQWIRELEAFIRDSVNASAPIFGVCFGLQVMATALGGTVEKFHGGWGVGVHDMNTIRSRPWMKNSHDSVSLIMSHQDQITRLPERASILGSSDHCENYLVEFTAIHVGIQGHPEFGVPFAEANYSKRREQPGDLFDRAVESLRLHTDGGLVASWIVEFFDLS